MIAIWADGALIVEEAAAVEEFTYEVLRAAAPLVHWNEQLGVISVVASNGTWRYRVRERTDDGLLADLIIQVDEADRAVAINEAPAEAAHGGEVR